MSGQVQRPLAAYATVTAAYWAFMLSDGALRMLVLLHFHEQGFSPVQLAYLFVLYEVAGIVTNMMAGYLAARFGLSKTLYAGLSLQIVALVALTQMSADWMLTLSVIYVMCVQGLSGVAKDLAKMSSKSAVKLLAPQGEAGLFRWVALLTGSKNAIKGLGFFLGACWLGAFGFEATLWGMALILGVILTAVLILMPAGLPMGSKEAKLTQIFATNPAVNWLSAARVTLFGARDVWFVVGIPIYFYAVLSDGTPEGNRAAFFLIGSFMAGWIIVYGFIQGAAPKILRSGGGRPRQAMRWALAAGGVPAALALLLILFPAHASVPYVVVAGLLIFGGLFAVNSSLHSYLILSFSSDERVTMDVGFYYMANAAGRLMGTLLSGISYQSFGVVGCLAVSACLLGISALTVRRIGVDASSHSSIGSPTL